MSTLENRNDERSGRRLSVGFGPRSRRALALAATLVLIGSILRVLTAVTDVAGGTDTLWLFVAGSLVAATVLARFLPTAGAVVLAAVLFGAGIWSYIQAVPNGALLLQSLDAVKTDILALLTGLSVLRIMAAGTWAVGFAPTPTFLVWYLSLRRHYVSAAVVGSAALGFFVLTGDAGIGAVLAGTAGAAGVVGFGELDRNGGSARQAETLVVVLAAMVVVAPFLSVVPGGTSQPLVTSGAGDGSGASTIEGGLLSAGDEVNVQGAITLSPKVRFTVESDREDYWRVAGYDRYTGQGWVRTGSSDPYDGSLAGPPGNATEVDQTYELRSEVGVLPAAWKPTELSGDVADDASVTALGGLQPDGELGNGTTYAVESQRPNATPAQLRAAGTAYPNEVASQYTQLPESTPDRVATRTDRVTANADNPYDTARTVERWLETTKNYSLDVDRPDGDIADAFLFEMDAGYCTYFATTMVTMLRSQDIPARFVTGYTEGQRVAEDEWVVRGYDSHAWVEVYFPETGWVKFDPTPAAPRSAVEQSNLEDARAGNDSNVDVNGSEAGEWTPTPTPTPVGATPTETTTPNDSNTTDGAPAGVDDQLQQAANQDGPDGANATNTTTTGGAADSGDGAASFDLELPSPSPRELLFVLVVLVGLAAAAHRTGVLERLYRELWLRVHPSGTPAAAVERSFDRLEYLLARDHRPRRAGETPREYLAVVSTDERVERVGEIFERAHYAGEVSRADADEAAGLVDQLVAERTPVVGRFRRNRRERGPDSI